MSEEPSHYRIKSLKLFVILIALLLIPSCTSHFIAPVQDKSQHVINRPKTHVVIPGDTLFSIAWRYGLKYEALAKHNGISAPYIIRPSQVIRLDVVGTHASQVAKGPLNQRIVNVKPYSKTGNKSPLSANKSHSGRQENKTEKAIGGANKVHAWAAPQWRWPASGALISTFQGSNALNKGIDLGGKLGEPVLAAAAGQVVYSGSGLRGYGKLLIVKHSETFLSAYAHNDKLLVKEGDFVKAGHRIADMGSSGTDRVKLHFEIRRDGMPVDPLKFLPRR
jgi:lipoprotein NlpD